MGESKSNIRIFLQSIKNDSMKKNNDIYEKAKECGVFLWKVAKKQNIGESTFFRKLREELPDKEKREILKIIKEISAQQKREADLGDD